MHFRKSFLLIAILLGLTALSSAQTVSVYQTTPDLTQALQPGSSLTFGSTGTGSATITINDSKTYQQMDGFGASFTDASAWLMYTKLSTAQRAAAMQMLFDPANGIGLSFLRQPMGSSDEALTFYSYDDLCAQTITACTSTGSDATLTTFSTAHDQAYILPVLQQALALNPNIKVMANPWSPPGWMKSNGTMLGIDGSNNTGSLRTDAYTPLANYFVKFIQAYQAAGVPITYVSMQNEPLYAPPTYAGMSMSSSEQINFLANYLGPAFNTAGIKSKVLVYDHNWDQWTYATTVLADRNAGPYTAGSAFHHYAGDPSVMSMVHDMYPSKDIWETEASGGTWQSGNILAQEALELINVARNWGKSYVLWNMALDQNHGPSVGGCNTCRGVMTIDWSNPNAVTFKPELDYYVLGQASKFLQPGAYRIDSDEATSVNIYDVAFRNPDGSIVVYALNNGASDQSFNVKYGSSVFTATVKAGSIATFTWAPTQSPAVALSADPNGLLLSAGKSGSLAVTVQPLNGANPTVSLACSGAPSTTTCTVSPNSLSFTSSAAQTVSVTITTKAASSAQRRAKLDRRSGFFLAGLLVFPAFAFAGSSKRRRKAMLLLAAASVLALALVSCGGGGGGGSTTSPIVPVVPGTPSGTSQLTITATPNSGAATEMSVFLTVQ